VGAGFIVAALFESARVPSLTHIIAIALLIITSALLVLAQAARDDLQRATQGLLEQHRPLALGLVRVIDLEEWKDLWLVAGLIAAGLLGWSVFLVYVFAELVQARAATLHIALAPCLRALSGAGYFLAGWMTVVERGSFGPLAPAFAALVFGLLFVWEGWKWRRTAKRQTLDGAG
jgi:hypothetical protein